MCALPEQPPKLLCTHGNVSKITQENPDTGFLFQTLTEQVFSQVESFTEDFNGADNPNVVVKQRKVRNHGEALLQCALGQISMQALPVTVPHGLTPQKCACSYLESCLAGICVTLQRAMPLQPQTLDLFTIGSPSRADTSYFRTFHRKVFSCYQVPLIYYPGGIITMLTKWNLSIS